MRITMLSIGSTGDVRPFILLGQELKRRGHQVTLAAFSDFEESVVQGGLSFWPLSGDAKGFISSAVSPETKGLTYLPRIIRELRSVFSQLVRDMDASCDGADGMICNFFGSVFYSIAEKHHIPCVQIYYSPMDPSRSMPLPITAWQTMPPWMNEATHRMGYLGISLVEKHFLTPWRRENHLDPRHLYTSPDYRAGDRNALVIYALSPHVIPRPAEWGEEIHMSGFLVNEAPSDWTPPADLTRFLEAGEMPVYLGFGSMNGEGMHELIAMIRESVRGAGLRAIVDLGWGGDDQSSSDELYFARYIPHDWLFPRVRGVVHHGGAGTTAAGLRYGKPTLVVPFFGDQYIWAHQVRRLNCGPAYLPRKKLSVDRLTASLRDLVDTPGYQESAESVGALLRQEHGVVTAADLIEKEIAASRSSS